MLGFFRWGIIIIICFTIWTSIQHLVAILTFWLLYLSVFSDPWKFKLSPLFKCWYSWLNSSSNQIQVIELFGCHCFFLNHRLPDGIFLFTTGWLWLQCADSFRVVLCPLSWLHSTTADDQSFTDIYNCLKFQCHFLDIFLMFLYPYF